MDLKLILFFCTSFLIILVCNLLLTKARSNHRLPPGPWKLPIIGSLHHLVSGSLPHHLLRDLARKYGPIMHLKLGEICTVVISSPRLAKEIMKTNDPTFAERPTTVASEILFYNKSDVAFAPYSHYWRKMRKICIMELLSPTNVKSLHFIREQEVLHMIDTIRLSIGLPINLSEKLFSLTNSIICRAAFGTKSPDELLSLTSEAFILMGGFDIADLFPSLEILHSFSSNKRSKLNLVHEKIDKYFGKIIAERRENYVDRLANKGHEGEDLLDVLLAFRQSENVDFPFTDANIKALISDMFLGGSETAATTIEWAMSEMIKNPKVMLKAQAEVRQWNEENKTIDMIEGDTKPGLSYLKLVIKEILRLHPPGPIFPRQSREACNIDGYNIPKKTIVLIHLWAIGRDPDVWEDAERFLPERFTNKSIDFMSNNNNFEFTPFGAGRRICPGISFGVAVIELALVHLLYHFNWTLPDGINPEDLDMTETSGITTRRKNNLCAIATSYVRANTL